MTKYNLEPLVIELNAPKGDYEITVSIKAHSDTVFSIFDETAGFVTEDRALRNGENVDIKFKTSTDNDIAVLVYCDGEITATAIAEYLN